MTGLTATQLGRRAAVRIVTMIYRRAIFLSHDLHPVDHGALPSSVRVGWLAPPDLEAYANFRPRSDLRQIRRRLERGDEAGVVWLGDRIVHAAWLAIERGQSAWLHREVVLGSGEALTYDSYTVKEQRRKGFGKARMHFVLSALRQRGFVRCWSIVAAENDIACRAARAAGYYPQGNYSSIGLGPWRKGWVTGGDVPTLVPRQR